jgi:ABC-type polysaccharide/polyol phosphate transport system ATPase subunit
MLELCGHGRTIVIVSHSLTVVRALATSAIWLHQGKIVEAGDPDDVTMAYMRYCRIEASNVLDDD